MRVAWTKWVQTALTSSNNTAVHVVLHIHYKLSYSLYSLTEQNGCSAVVLYATDRKRLHHDSADCTPTTARTHLFP